MPFSEGGNMGSKQYFEDIAAQWDTMRKGFFSEGVRRDVNVDCAGENCCAQSGCGSQQANVSIFVASGRK
jgi:hypothetical protein